MKITQNDWKKLGLKLDPHKKNINTPVLMKQYRENRTCTDVHQA